MQAHIISIGNEILIGQTIDTNSNWLARELTKLGIRVIKIVTVADNKVQIIDTLNNSFKSADLLILSGGLGPTNDDITKATLTEYFNDKLVFSETIYADVLSFLEKRGSKTNGLNKKQALIPKQAKILRNSNGTAPGLVFQKNNKMCISMPGVPSEMRSIMQEYGFDLLKRTFKLPYNFYHTLLLTGIAEAHLAERIAEWEQALPQQISIAYLPSPGLLKIRLGAIGDNKKEIEEQVLKEVTKLKKLVPEYIFGQNDERFEQLIGELLKNKKQTVASAESCTGGKIASTFTALSGSSQWYKGSVVAYSNEAKRSILNVPKQIIEQYGAVSEPVVLLMAKGAKKRLNTDFCVSTSGIAGPTGGSEEKPVGTVWIAVSGPNGEVAKCFKFGKEREINIKRATNAALNMLLTEIKNV